MSAPAAVYRTRNPQSSDYYRCVEDHFETFLHVYEERFERKYGGDPISKRSFTGISIVEICIMASSA